MPINWDRMHYELSGRPMDGPEPVQNKHIKALGQDLLKILTNKSLHAQIVQAFTKEGQKRGIHPSYMWWTLAQSTSYWPNMTSMQYMLAMFARAIVSHHGYDKSINIPIVPGDEDVFDVAFLAAVGAMGKILGKTMKDYEKLTQKHGKELAKDSDKLQKSEGPGTIRVLFKHAVSHWDTWWEHGDLLQKYLALQP